MMYYIFNNFRIEEKYCHFRAMPSAIDPARSPDLPSIQSTAIIRRGISR